MADDDWSIPEELRPDPADYAFDLARALGAVVGLKSRVPSDAFSARTLGTEREGSGAVIRADGLVLTIGYLVGESESIWITTSTGRVVPGHALAYDFETGFGLVQALGRLETPALELGPEITPETGVQTVLAAAAEDPVGGAIASSIVAKEPFAGYWEYLLEEALFTAPAHPSWGGAALIGPDGKLAGIGSLVLQHRDKRGKRLDLNMCVPVTLLHPDHGRPAELRPGEQAGAAMARALRRGPGGRRRGRLGRVEGAGGTGGAARRRPHPRDRRVGGRGPGGAVAQPVVARPAPASACRCRRSATGGSSACRSRAWTAPA